MHERALQFDCGSCIDDNTVGVHTAFGSIHVSSQKKTWHLSLVLSGLVRGYWIWEVRDLTVLSGRTGPRGYLACSFVSVT